METRDCTECGKSYTPYDGIYGLVCPHCKQGQRTELPSRGQGKCCLSHMDKGNNRMDCPEKHREDNAEVIYLRKLLHDLADKMHAANGRADEAERRFVDLMWRSEEKVKVLDAEIERLNALLSGR